MRKLLLSALVALPGFIASPSYAEDAPAAPAIEITTTAFLDQGIMPVLYTCDGKDLSPELTWAKLPDKTQSVAIVMADPEAPDGTFYHWILYNIPTSVTTLSEGIDKMPAGVMVGKNSFGKLKYNGPCPPKGTAHNYIFTLYALDSKLTIPAGANGKAVEDAIKNHIVGKIELTASYSRWLE